MAIKQPSEDGHGFEPDRKEQLVTDSYEATKWSVELNRQSLWNFDFN